VFNDAEGGYTHRLASGLLLLSLCVESYLQTQEGRRMAESAVKGLSPGGKKIRKKYGEGKNKQTHDL